MKKLYFVSLLTISFASLSGCKTVSSTKSQYAIISQHSAESLVELESVINTAIGKGKVSLNDDTLTSNSQLIIERKQHQSIEHGKIMGRHDEVPEIFNLILKNDQCMLVHQQTKKEWPLYKAQCKPYQLSAQ
ncbi:hypothetical protein [Aliikangiella sp. IMCC44359]|uniref:hypothetical protein n=1 Tax=Aliikangiella sp. IMCC44359 TaxID=3459125 RepID=UPI00403ACFF1